MILVIEKHFDKLEEQRKRLLEEVEKLRPEQQTFRPAPDAWCMLEVIDHIALSEFNALRYMLKKIQGVDSIEKTDVFSSIRARMLNTFLKLPLKYTAPPAAEIQRREYYDFKEVTKEWADVREEYKEFLDNFDIPTSDKLIFKHPAMGRFNIIQTLDFQYEHVDHHIKQIERIKNNPEYPK